MPLKGNKRILSDDIIYVYPRLNSKPSEKTTLITQVNKQKTEQTAKLATTSVPVAILNLVKSLLGAAMLSLPWAFSLSTFIPACIGLLFVVVYSFITCMFIVNACEVTKTFEYSALLKYVHPYWETAATIILIYVSYSSCLSYVILIGDFFTDGIHGLHHSFAFAHDRQIYIAVVTCCILLPLSLLKEFKSLKASSIIGNLSNLYCVFLAIGFTAVYYPKSGAVNEGFTWNDWDMNILIVTNVCAKGFCSHYPLPPMYEQLKDRSVSKIRFVIFCAFAIVSAIYFSFAFCGYYLFGNSTDGDVLLNYPSANIWFIVARFAMGFSIIGCYPLIFKSLVQCVEDKFFSFKKGAKYNFVEYPKVRVVAISVCVLSMMVIGILVNNVGPVSSIEGAVTVLGLIALFPILVAWKVGNAEQLNRSRRRLNNYRAVDTESQLVGNDEKKLDRRGWYVFYLGVMLLFGVFLGVAGITLQFVLL